MVRAKAPFSDCSSSGKVSQSEDIERTKRRRKLFVFGLFKSGARRDAKDKQKFSEQRR